jgi:hypothetical protein
MLPRPTPRLLLPGKRVEGGGRLGDKRLRAPSCKPLDVAKSSHYKGTCSDYDTFCCFRALNHRLGKAFFDPVLRAALECIADRPLWIHGPGISC